MPFICRRLRAEHLRTISQPVAKGLAIIIGSVLLWIVVLARLDIQGERFTRNPLDAAWQISLAASLEQGAVSGRDFYFTYGPLAQLTARLGQSLNSGTALDGFFAIQLAFHGLTCLLWALTLALIRPLDWKWIAAIFLGLALLNIVRDVAAVRMLFLMLIGVMVSRAMSASTAKRQAALAALTGGLCFVAQLLTFDSGLLGLGVVLGALSLYAIFARFPRMLAHADLLPARRYLALALIATGVYGVANLVLSSWFALTSATGLFDYLYYNWEILRGYNATMGIGWRPSPSTLMGLALVGLYAIVAVLSQLRRLKTPDGALLVSLLAVSVIVLRGLFIRSDWGHITMALIPLVGLILLLGRFMLALPRGRVGWAAIVVLLFAVWPGADFTALAAVPKMIGDSTTLSTHWQALTTFRMPHDNLWPADLATDLPDASRPLLVFPYQNYLAIGLRRPLQAPVLQAFLAHTTALQRRYIDQLEAQAGTFDVVYAVDDVASWPVDGVQHVTRLPIIFQYLAEHYQLHSVQANASGYYVLQPRTHPAPLHANEQRFEVTQLAEGTLVRLEQAATCSLIRLELTITYPLTAWVGRPDILDAQITTEGREVNRSGLVAIETGQAFTTYLSLIKPDQFYEVFGTGSVQSQTWDTLTLRPRLTGFPEVLPNRIDIQRVACINF